MLFEIGTPLQAIINSDKSYKWIMDNSTKINLASKATVDKFYKIYMNDDTKMYRYVLSPEFGQVSSNFRMRFLLISVNNDLVFVPIKVIDLMGRGESYISISMEPISQNSCKENVIEVLKALQEFPCIHFIIRNETEEKTAIDNNFYNVRSYWSEMNRSKWKSKHGINIMESLIEFHPDAEKLPNIAEDIYKVNQIWADIKTQNKANFSSTNKSIDKKLAIMASEGSAVHIYSFSYKGKLIGYAIPIHVIDKYVVLMSIKQITADYESLVNYIGEDTEELQKVFKYISAYIQYKIHQDIFERLNFEAVYIFGDTKIPGLKVFKQKYYKSLIHYNKYSLAEYIKILEQE